MRILLILAFLILSSCQRSPEPLYYVLQPLSPVSKLAHHHSDKIIGLEESSLPAYVNKPPLVLQFAPNQVEVNEHHLWAEELAKNVTRVIQTNLTILLPGSTVVRAPWSPIQFQPSYRVQVSILQFNLDTLGSASLMAQYLIFDQDKLIKKGQGSYSSQALPVCFASLVHAMNENLTKLTLDIARDLAG